MLTTDKKAKASEPGKDRRHRKSTHSLETRREKKMRETRTCKKGKVRTN